MQAQVQRFLEWLRWAAVLNFCAARERARDGPRTAGCTFVSPKKPPHRRAFNGLDPSVMRSYARAELV
jgi:hypothetical protein